MVTSYNGWPASPSLPLRPLVVAGESFSPGVLDDGDVWTVLNYVAVHMHERVERIYAPGWHEADDWGFYYRLSTGSTSALSCHASGTAIDYNATRHPYGVATSRNFTPAQIAEIRKIVNEAGVIRWGGEWTKPDAMHFEIQGTRAQVAAAAARIRNSGRDGIDMANLDDLRRIVREEIRDPEFIAKIGDEVWRREFSAVNANGVTVKKPAREYLTSLWETLKRHMVT